MQSLNEQLDFTRRQLSACVNDYLKASAEWAIKKGDFKEALFRELSGASGSSEKIREANAMNKVMREYKDYLKAEALYEALKVKVGTLQSDLSALQSQASTARVEQSLALAPEPRWSPPPQRKGSL